MSSSSEEKKCQTIVERSMEKLCEIFCKTMEQQQSKVNTETVNHTLEPNPVKLSGSGSYISWARHAKLILSSHGYVHLLMTREDEEGDSGAKQINDRVLVWLFGSMESVIREQVETLATVTEVWLELEKQFAGKSNKMHAMRIMHELTHLKQGSKSVIEYAGEMKKLYRDLHFYHPFEAVDMKNMAIHHTWFQALVSKLFLDGLNQEFDLRRQLIFSHSEWPCLDDIIFSVLEEETRLAHPKLDSPNGVGARATLSIHNSHTTIFQKDQGRTKPDSENCKFEGHTKEECFNLHGDPPGWRKGNFQHGGVPCVRQNLHQNSEGSQIDGSQYEENMKLLEADEQEYFTIYDEVHDSFDDMSLQENLLRGIYAYGFEKPSGIQQRGIVPFCRGLDVIQQSRSGTGKTAAFCTGVLQQVDYGLNQCQALVLAPTRELAQQIAKVMRALGEYLPVKVHVCVGGTNIRDDKRILSDGVHVVVGTPGRVFDMLRRQSLRAEHIRIFVLDEADEMLPNDQIYDISQLLPTKVQVGIFSSAMLPEVVKITRKFMNKPVRILAKHDDELTIKGIKQFYKDIHNDEFKLIFVKQIYEKLDITQSVIFVSTRKKVDWLTEKLPLDCTVLATHGDMNQNRADAIMREFRSGDQSRVLITTDQLAHDIPMQHVSLVISFDLPTQPKNYLHRIGRMGNKGLAIIFVISNDHDRNMFHDIQKFYKMEMDKLPVDMGIVCL